MCWKLSGMTPGAPVLTQSSRKRGGLFLVKSLATLQRPVLQLTATLVDQRDERAIRRGSREDFAGLHCTLAQDREVMIVAQDSRELVGAIRQHGQRPGLERREELELV